MSVLFQAWYTLRLPILLPNMWYRKVKHKFTLFSKGPALSIALSPWTRGELASM
jgi:hypothetical protein